MAVVGRCDIGGYRCRLRRRAVKTRGKLRLIRSCSSALAAVFCFMTIVRSHSNAAGHVGRDGEAVWCTRCGGIAFAHCKDKTTPSGICHDRSIPSNDVKLFAAGQTQSGLGWYRAWGEFLHCTIRLDQYRIARWKWPRSMTMESPPKKAR
jgi:hypothetical protein